MSNLRRFREAAGLSQSELAERAGVSRQLVGAAEAGRNIPRVDAGLALADALGVSAEELFAAASVPTDVLTGGAADEGVLLRAGIVGDRRVTAPLDRGSRSWGIGDGVVEHGRYGSFHRQREGLVVAGCEPGLELLERELRQSGAAAVSVMASSGAAISALLGGRTHAAVVHGPALDRADEFPELARFRLAGWQVGLADAPDAGAGWFEEALGGHTPVVQRETGAGVQQAFEAAADATGEVPGPRVGTHLEAAARAVYGGIPAVTIEPAARALGAEFRSLGFHETQLWVAPQWITTRVVTDALDVIGGQSYVRRMMELGGYDLTDFGTRLA
ncbi:MAG: helix-turn-helix domain-containing protein [bacterium]|nr:helix-turn-helix domain-containing protein [bacterium]